MVEATPLVRWKDLCIDAVDGDDMARFWSAALGLRVAASWPRTVRLDGRTPEHTVWVNRVPEPVTVKQRVHLDVHVASVDDLVDLGARVVDPSQRWTVLADPEGGELCAFVREVVPEDRLYELAVDAVDPEAQATWWATAFGAEVGRDEAEPWWWVEGIEGAPFESIVFAPVPEPKLVKNRVHWDVTLNGPDALGRLRRAGATVLQEPGPDTEWHVLADPEGNEFCAFAEGD